MALNLFQELTEFITFFLLRCVLPVTLVSVLIYIFILYKPLLKPFYLKMYEKEVDKKILVKWYKRKRIGKKRRENFAFLCTFLSFMIVWIIVSHFFGTMKDSVLYVTGEAKYEEVTVTKIWSERTARGHTPPFVRTLEKEEHMYYEGVFLHLNENKVYRIKYLPHNSIILNYEEVSTLP